MSSNDLRVYIFGHLNTFMHAWRPIKERAVAEQRNSPESRFASNKYHMIVEKKLNVFFQSP